MASWGTNSSIAQARPEFGYLTPLRLIHFIVPPSGYFNAYITYQSYILGTFQIHIYFLAIHTRRLKDPPGTQPELQ